MDFFAGDMSFEKASRGGDCLEIRGFEHSRERTRTRNLAWEWDFPPGLLTAAANPVKIWSPGILQLRDSGVWNLLFTGLERNAKCFSWRIQGGESKNAIMQHNLSCQLLRHKLVLHITVVHICRARSVRAYSFRGEKLKLVWTSYVHGE